MKSFRSRYLAVFLALLFRAPLGADPVDWRAVDARGDRIVDFSFCGYRASEVEIPDVPVRVVVRPGEGDDGIRIQAALDHVARLPSDTNGRRGAVLLTAGSFEVAGQLRLEVSGVVLRGSGFHDAGTTIVATGASRRTLIRIRGESPVREKGSERFEVAPTRVPVGALRLPLEHVEDLRAGDTVTVTRPSTEAWVKAIGMDVFGVGWRAGTRDLHWDRQIESIAGTTVTLDAPLTTALEPRFGGGHLRRVRWPGRIREFGVENLRLTAAGDPGAPNREARSWVAVTIENAIDGWLRRVDFRGFTAGAVYVWETSRRVTVEDCRAREPVSEIGGGRRRHFFTSGQQTLFQRCSSEDGIEDFVVGHAAAGPNAFVTCSATRSQGTSGSAGSWASGVLFDGVRLDGGTLALENLESRHRSAGWAAANSVLWQCSASEIHCSSPATAINRAFGAWGHFEGDGLFIARNEFVSPRSLFAAQLEARRGPEAVRWRGPELVHPPGTTNPTLEQARAMAEDSSRSAPTVLDLILDAPRRDPIPVDPGDAPDIERLLDATIPPEVISRRKQRLAVTDGRLTIDGRLALGAIYRPVWWRGNLRPGEREQYGHAITRFVPGRYGQGFTDELPEVVEHLVSTGHGGLEHHHGLWYDRRRDDHQRVRRTDGAVEPPFYEMPWARSGRGIAWDGLSLYDLTTFEPWYSSRLEEFARLADERGLVFLVNHSFQHNLLEAGAHWSDFPWRSANNVNQTGFPEPPPYAGDKRIFQAHLFYDPSHPARRELHRETIRHHLDLLAASTCTLHRTGAEFTGPREYVEFWIDVIRDWERETGHDALVTLGTTRDVQKAILADPGRASAVSVIDIRQWWYERDGELHAPPGGANLSPRQFRRLLRPRSSSSEQTVRAIREMRERHPRLAVIVTHDRVDPWAVLIAEGSLPAVPPLPVELRKALPGLRFSPRVAPADSTWALAKPGGHGLVYSRAGSTLELDLSEWSGTLAAWRIDPETGTVTSLPDLAAGGHVRLEPGSPSPVILWFHPR